MGKTKFKKYFLIYLLLVLTLSHANMALAAETTSGKTAVQQSIETYLCTPTDVSKDKNPKETGVTAGTTLNPFSSNTAQQTQANQAQIQNYSGANNQAKYDLYICINKLYKFAIAIGSVIAVGFLVIAGYLYMASEGNAESVDKAKSIMVSSITAMVILFSGYILLKAINPDLITFQNIQPPSVKLNSATDTDFQPLYDASGNLITTAPTVKPPTTGAPGAPLVIDPPPIITPPIDLTSPPIGTPPVIPNLPPSAGTPPPVVTPPVVIPPPTPAPGAPTPASPTPPTPAPGAPTPATPGTPTPAPPRPTTPTPAPPASGAAQVASQILSNQPAVIVLASIHSSAIRDNATALQNIKDAAANKAASRSSYQGAPGSTVTLNPTMLQALAEITKNYKINVSEIAGGSHPAENKNPTSPNGHYGGNAFDINYVNGEHLTKNNKYIEPIIQLCKRLGAKQVLNETATANHVHCGAFPVNPRG